MDALLARLGAQAFNYAIRSGIAFTSTYAVQQCSRLLKTVNDKALHKELKSLQKHLYSKVKILSPAIDLIEFKSGRGNVFLESAVPLAKSLHREIVRLGKRLDDAATSEEATRLAGSGRKSPMSDAHHAELMLIIKDIQALLLRIDRDIALIQLAITASGEKMNSALAPGISPSRMMQIGPSFTLSLYMLFLGHAHANPRSGKDDVSLPTPDLSEEDSPNEEPYGLGEGERKPIWQEVIHKARVRLCRTPLDWTFERSQGYCPKAADSLELDKTYSSTSAIAVLARSDEYSYHLEIVEDMDDGRVHDEDGSKPEPFNDMAMAGIRESIPIHQIAKIFYTDTGRILNIRNAGDGENNPVLLLKRDVNAKTPVKLRQEWFEDSEDSQGASEESSLASYDQSDVDRQLREESELPAKPAEVKDAARVSHLPSHLDPQWLALEVYTEDDGYGDDQDDSEDEEEEEEEEERNDSSNGDSSGSPSDDKSDRRLPIARPRLRHGRSSVDSDLRVQINKMSVKSSSPPRAISRLSLDEAQQTTGSVESNVARSPFGSIVTSLSLLEMLIRLTSLQEFQQTSHLSIPDHILTFFLDETSTTGLRGEAHWALRKEAKRRVGFDPYTDTPMK